MLIDNPFNRSFSRSISELPNYKTDESITNVDISTKSIKRNNKKINDKNNDTNESQLLLSPPLVKNLTTFSDIRNDRSKSSQQLDLQENHCSTRPSTQNTYMNCFDSVLSKTSITTHKDSHDLFPRITVETLKEIICDNKIHNQFYDSYKIIDSRFDYEFQGGHIKGALNISSTNEIESRLLSSVTVHSIEKPTLLIFHCEFSSHRGPTLASHLRNCDRIINQNNYPSLYYPDILLLDGGYKEFYNKFPELCFPRNYVAMNSTENLRKCEIQLEKFRIDSKKIISRDNSIRSFRSTTNLNTDYSKDNILKFDIPTPMLSLLSPSSIKKVSGDEYSEDNENDDIPSVDSSRISINKFLMMKDLDNNFFDSAENDDDDDSKSEDNNKESKVGSSDGILKYHGYEDYPYNKCVFNSKVPVSSSSNRLCFHNTPTFE